MNFPVLSPITYTLNSRDGFRLSAHTIVAERRSVADPPRLL